jgi:anti-sigma factor RsiW
MTAGNANDDFDDELLSAYVDGELTASERALVEERIKSDAGAAALVEEMRSLSSAIKSLPRETLGRDLRAGVLAEVEQARADLAQHGPAAQHDAATLAPPVDRWAGMRRGLVWSALAIAATVLVAVFQPAEVEQKERELARAEQRELRDAADANRVELQERRAGLSDESGVSKEKEQESVDKLAETNGTVAEAPPPPGPSGSMSANGVKQAEAKALEARPTEELAAPAAPAPLTASALEAEQMAQEPSSLPAAGTSLDAMFAESGESNRSDATLQESLERSTPLVTSRSAASSEEAASKPADAPAAFGMGGMGGGGAEPRGGAALDAATPANAPANLAAKAEASGEADAEPTKQVMLKLARPDGAVRFRELLAESQISPASEEYREYRRRHAAGESIGESTRKLATLQKADAEGIDQAEKKAKSDAADDALRSFYFFSELDRGEMDADRWGGRGGEQGQGQAGWSDQVVQPGQADGEQLVWVEASPEQIDALLEKCRAAETAFATVELNDPLASATAKLGTPLRTKDGTDAKSLAFKVRPMGDAAIATRERVLFVLKPPTILPAGPAPTTAAPAAKAAGASGAK